MNCMNLIDMKDSQDHKVVVNIDCAEKVVIDFSLISGISSVKPNNYTFIEYGINLQL